MVQLAPKQKSSDFNKICFGSNKLNFRYDK